jgi:hypothetical protein
MMQSRRVTAFIAAGTTRVENAARFSTIRSAE